jgi:myo-inositol-hexaphosphate 3-phosphohydrolase
MEETSTAVNLPHILIEVLPHNALFLSSPTHSIIVSKESGEILYTLTHAQILQAPRCSSVHFLEGPQLEEDAVDCLIALLGDDKELNVYKINGLSAQKVSMNKVFSSPLPKRGVKMVWEQTSEKERTLIVGDRHGDVRR